MKKVFKLLSINLLVTFVLLETLTQFFYYIPFDSRFTTLIKEAVSDTNSNIRIYNRLNEFGSRRIKLPKEQKAAAVVVGDSFAFGASVREADTFPSVIARKLKKKVVNLGVSGTYPKYYNRMVEVGMQYSPDLIIYCIYANDIFFDHLFDCSHEAFMFYGPARYAFDRQLFTRENKLTYALAGLKKRAFNAFKSWQAIQAFFKIITIRSTDWWYDIVPVKFEDSVFYCNPSFWQAGLNLKNQNVLKTFYKTIEYIIDAYNFCRLQNKQFLVVLIPCKEMIYGPLSKAFDAGPMIETYNELTSQLKKQNIPVLNLTKFMMEKELENNNEAVFEKYWVHLKESGNRAVAERIARYLRDDTSGINTVHEKGY